IHRNGRKAGFRVVPYKRAQQKRLKHEGIVTMLSVNPQTARFMKQVLALVLLFTTSTFAAPQQSDIPDVTAMSMEDLMNMQVTSVSKRSQKLADAAAAVFVITQDAMRRSGA